MSQQEAVVKLDEFLVAHGPEALLKGERVPLSGVIFSEAHQREQRRRERLTNGGDVKIEEDQAEQAEPETPPAFPEIAWRGPFQTYRQAMQDTTEASDVHHFAAFWAAVAVRLRRRVRIHYGMNLYPNVYLVAFGPPAIGRLLRPGEPSPCWTTALSESCMASEAGRDWVIG